MKMVEGAARLGCWGLLLALAPSGAVGEDAAGQEVEFFESRIRPVLHRRCYSCHSRQARIVRGGLLVDSRQGLLAGGDSGPAVAPGKPEDSLLLAALQHDGLEMPPDGKLEEAVIADFRQWIARGAVDPRAAAAAPTSRIDPVAARSHWAFQPLRQPPVPPLPGARAGHPIDAFVFSQLQHRGWRPARAADKHTLLRRATFDLVGLPPTPAEIDAFLADSGPGSFERVVDRLLASPHHGERWGRHWLDLVRYADTNGADENHKMPDAWRYRDWVIGALNRDLPLNEFLTQQLAGDLLPQPADEAAAGRLLAATGMLVIGPKMLAEQDKEKMRIDIIDEQIDTVSRTMLGMTIACARCHDHKFDPISTEDYYALAGIFASTRTMLNQDFVSKWMERPLPSSAVDRRIARHQQRIAAARQRQQQLADEARQQFLQQHGLKEPPKDYEKRLPEAARKAIAAAAASLQALEKAAPKHDMVMAVEERSPANLPVHIRGNHLTKAADEVPRGAPQRLIQEVPLPPIGSGSSGRLELARWLTSPDHPLTARVMANRLWMWHFGQPLAPAPSNFGLQSPRPLHADLLDWLAAELIRNQWSLKRMHRLIMSSRTYQMSSRHRRSAQYAGDDPANNYLWRQNRRRLEVEPLRDAILCAGDSLCRNPGGPPADHGDQRRTVYLLINRAALDELFSTFDYVEPANHIEQRPVTTVPAQAMFLLNNPLVHQQAARLAGQVLRAVGDDRQRAAEIWLRLHGKPADPQQLDRLLQFVAQARPLIKGDAEAQEQAVWASLCRSLLAGSPFCYVD